MFITESAYLEHYGVQGMKWGVRRQRNKARVAELQGQGLSKRRAKRTVRVQNAVDAQKMAATGRQGKVSVLKQLNNRAISTQQMSLITMARHPISVKKGSERQLRKNREIQAKVNNGQRSASATLLRLQGVSIKDLDFNT